MDLQVGTAKIRAPDGTTQGIPSAESATDVTGAARMMTRTTPKTRTGSARGVLSGISWRKLSEECGRMRGFDERDLIGKLGQHGVFSPALRSLSRAVQKLIARLDQAGSTTCPAVTEPM
jgi:hypothetical protein